MLLKRRDRETREEAMRQISHTRMLFLRREPRPHTARLRETVEVWTYTVYIRTACGSPRHDPGVTGRRDSCMLSSRCNTPPTPCWWQEPSQQLGRNPVRWRRGVECSSHGALFFLGQEQILWLAGIRAVKDGNRVRSMRENIKTIRTGCDCVFRPERFVGLLLANGVVMSLNSEVAIMTCIS